MANPKDIDILTRSLSGDWLSRIEFFKKFIWDNSRVRRLGAGHQNQDDFLHDCLTNVLRTGHSFNAESNLGEWIESVAASTALERQRSHHENAPDEPRTTRMCAAMEEDEVAGRARLASYVPPRSGPEDSLIARISALVGEPQFTILFKRAVEDSSWEDAAAAAGKPLNAIGPLMVRTVGFLCRFFGAPPPLNVDLEPVFAWVVREEAAVSHGDPSKPKGRILPMQLDPGFYALTPEMRKIGLTVPAEVRSIALWDAARSSTPPSEALREHLKECHYCADLLRAILLMQEALQSDPQAAFLLCPGGFTLLNTPDGASEAFDRHLEECAVCRQERARACGDVEADGTRGPGASVVRSGWGKKMAWAAVVLLLLGGGVVAGRRYFGPADPASRLSVLDAAPPTVTSDPRYSGLAERVAINDPRWIATTLPEHRRMVAWMINEINNGHAAQASVVASGLAGKDPGVQMLYAETRYQLNDAGSGYQEMRKAEAMSPRNSFRCWATLQAAVVIGDMKTATEEVEHLSSDPEYGARAKALLARLRARG